MAVKQARSSRRKSREDWIEAGLQVLGQQGVDRVKVEPLARQLRVTKGSFYWHFADRDALLTAMLEYWEQTNTLAIIEQTEASGGDARERLAYLMSLTERDYEGQVELALRDWGRRDEAVAAMIQRVDVLRMNYLRKLLREAGFSRAAVEARALLMYALLIGDYFIRVPFGSYSRKRVWQEVYTLLTRPESGED